MPTPRFVITLFLPLWIGCGDNQDTNDAPAAESTIELTAPANVPESGMITFTVTRTGDLKYRASVIFQLTAGTATTPEEFEPIGGVLTWEPLDGDAKTLMLPIKGDYAIEGDETLTATISNPSLDTVIGPSSSVTVTITDANRIGDAVVVLSDSRVITFDRAVPDTLTSVAPLSGIAAGVTVLDIDYRPADRLLYGLLSNGTLVSINPATGVATLEATLAADPADLTAPFTALDTSATSIDINPVPDRVRIVSQNGLNLRADPTTGLVFTDGAINGASTGAAGVAYTNSAVGAVSTTLYAIDVASDQLMIQNPPNNGTTTAVGTGLGVDATAVRGFDIAFDGTTTNTAIALLTVGLETHLYSINLTTGTATMPFDIRGVNVGGINGFAMQLPPP